MDSPTGDRSAVKKKLVMARDLRTGRRQTKVPTPLGVKRCATCSIARTVEVRFAQPPCVASGGELLCFAVLINWLVQSAITDKGAAVSIKLTSAALSTPRRPQDTPPDIP